MRKVLIWFEKEPESRKLKVVSIEFPAIGSWRPVEVVALPFSPCTRTVLELFFWPVAFALRTDRTCTQWPKALAAWQWVKVEIWFVDDLHPHKHGNVICVHGKSGKEKTRWRCCTYSACLCSSRTRKTNLMCLECVCVCVSLCVCPEKWPFLPWDTTLSYSFLFVQCHHHLHVISVSIVDVASRSTGYTLTIWTQKLRGKNWTLATAMSVTNDVDTSTGCASCLC